MLLQLLNGVAAATAVTLRLTVYYFVRWLPLGPRYLPIIYANFSAWIVCYLVAVAAQPKHSRKTSSLGAKLLTLLVGWYDRTHVVTSIWTFLINVFALLFALDFVYRAEILGSGNGVEFSRLGYVDDNSARIVIRHSEISQIFYQASGQSKWLNGPVATSTPESDFVSTLVLTGLERDTSYNYHTNTSLAGSFRTSSSSPKKWSLATSSCIKPGFPYNPAGSELRIPGLEHLSSHVTKSSIDMVLFLGDFIYIDLPARFGFSNEHYRNAYRQVYASPSWTQELQNTPWIHMYDDHEITNDWAANETGLWTDAMEPYFAYHHGGNPEPLAEKATYYTFKKGDVAFFVMDTRRYRSPEDVEDGPGKTMLGESQRKALEHWLRTERGWKMVVSSVPFTRNWRGPESIDSWAGYLWERQQLLEVMWATDGVVILSGDRHEHATTEFPSPDGKKSVVEFSTSPLSQFFQPFDRQYRQIEVTDIELFSHPYGVSKFGVLKFDTTSRKTWHLDFELIVDGKGIWNKRISLER
ncbi:hypothetical protein BP6252_11428 [Coleophoma cylindrospora]|uniref:PhoD-like phosphatase metallophosphatase domain-containing protein n=1 Tax=Coleophoma cylindrospora TaxID=1849047 RepID=A0A3D8QJL2_9HELO|nr:hypothetical protein BP6252_11428 [Coleophoma cylindrospora]